MKILRMQCFTFDNFKKFKIVIIAIEYMNVEFILFTCFDNNYISCLLRLWKFYVGSVLHSKS